MKRCWASPTGDDIGYAIFYGQTLLPRLFLAFCALLHGGGLATGSPGWMTSPAAAGLSKLLPISWWALAYILIGVLGAWRVVAPTPRPLLAYGINALILSVWNASLIARVFIYGLDAVLSVYTVICVLAFWCLLRTEATPRDTRTA